MSGDEDLDEDLDVDEYGDEVEDQDKDDGNNIMIKNNMIIVSPFSPPLPVADIWSLLGSDQGHNCRFKLIN